MKFKTHFFTDNSNPKPFAGFEEIPEAQITLKLKSVQKADRRRSIALQMVTNPGEGCVTHYCDAGDVTEIHGLKQHKEASLVLTRILENNDYRELEESDEIHRVAITFYYAGAMWIQVRTYTYTTSPFR